MPDMVMLTLATSAFLSLVVILDVLASSQQPTCGRARFHFERFVFRPDRAPERITIVHVRFLRMFEYEHKGFHELFGAQQRHCGSWLRIADRQWRWGRRGCLAQGYVSDLCP
jgi:hypothetical protein